jgi:fengycin family lipopeptide synthetase D
VAIEMSGSVYCPLSPRDPEHRLHSLLQQTQSRLVLVHYLTKVKFSDDNVSLDIDTVVTENDMKSNVDVVPLSSVVVTPENIAYIIFTSGSTGTPKAVSIITYICHRDYSNICSFQAQVRHRNFTECVQSLNFIDSFNEKDTIVQMSRCSFDIHVQEILGTLMIGAALVMLHPRGNIDFDYLSQTLTQKQISYMHSVPSLLHSFFIFLKETNNLDATKHLRTLCSSGK